MKKIYKTRFHELSILVVLDDGEKKTIDFKRDLIDDYGTRGAVFITKDNRLQQAIEKHEFFKRKLEPNVWTDDIENKSNSKTSNIKEK